MKLFIGLVMTFNPQSLLYFDISLVIIHVFICLYISYYYFKKIKNPDDFSFGVKGASTIMFVCSIFATAVGAGSTIGYVDKLYDGGFIIFIFIQPFSWILTSKILVPKIYNLQFCSTLSQAVGKLYGTSASFVTVFAIVLETIGTICMQSMGIGVILEYFFGIEFLYGVFIGYSVIALYGMIGGIRGIMAIDVYQFILFFLIIPIAYVVVSSRFNGVEEILLKIPKSEFKFEFNFKNFIILISVLVTSLMPAVSAPYMHRYLMLCETPKKLKTIFNYLFCITIPFIFSIFVIAYIMKANYFGVGENIMLKFISEYVPVGLKGLMIVGLFAIIMSTSDSHINSASVALTKDLIKVLCPRLTEKQELRVLRSVVLIISIIPLFILSKNLFELIWIFRACGIYLIIIPLFAALYYFPANLKSFYIGIATGLIFIFLTLKFLPEYTLLYVLTEVHH